MKSKPLAKILELILDKYEYVFDKDIIKNHRSIDDIRTRLVDAAHQVQHVIDSMVSSSDLKSQHLMWLYDLSEGIKHVKMQLIDYCDNNPLDVGVQSFPFRDQHLASPLATGTMVGFQDEKAAILDSLIKGTSRLEVVSITGMPGSGKTTLAKNVYNDLDIKEHFYTRVWCHVSQEYKKRDLLCDMIKSLMEERDEKLATKDDEIAKDDTLAMKDGMLAMKDEDLCSLLHLYLRSRRYHIVMDDVWSSDPWDDLKSSFPDNSYGNRILMTSRIYNVVPNSHPLRGLTHDESLELLKMLVSSDEGCPPKLHEVGWLITENCRGLPLAIVLVARLLIIIPMEQWAEVAESTGSQIVNAQVTESMRIFERSYQYLPDHLKQCFLYFGVSPKDGDISVRRLLWLWIAEGFIHDDKGKSLEELAEEYFMELIQRSLVIRAKQRSNGGVKTCRIHDEILDFCLSKAKEANFLHLVSGEPSYGSPNGPHYEDRNPSKFTKSSHWLSICGDPEEFIASRPLGATVHTLQFLASDEMYPGCDSDVSFISDNFKLLKVLDLESINIGNSLQEGIGSLVLLKYLAIGGDMDSIPSSVSNLRDLETLIVKGVMNKFVLPDTIWSMKRLRHIHVTNHCIFTLQYEENGRYSELDGLVSLSMPSFTCGEETNYTIRRFPNVRKLKCIFLQPRGRSMHVCQFPDLRLLSQLETLEITYHGRPLKTGEFIFPSTLRKLTLSNFRLSWDRISAIGRLPNLEVLKLISRAFIGSSWVLEGELFPNLRYLKLDSLDFVHWDILLDDYDDLFPSLEQLVLRNCWQLEEVPSIFGQSATLQRIEVHQCGISIEESVIRIAEEQREWGNDDLISVFT